MQYFLIIFLYIFFSGSFLFAANNGEDIFSAEGDAGKLPRAVEEVLKNSSPDTAELCGFSGKEIFLSNSANADGTHYYAVGPGPGGCIGSGGTTLWIVSLKDKSAGILIEDDGYQITKLEKISQGLHDIRFTSGGSSDFKILEWSYDGAKYQRITYKFFVYDDCTDSFKSKDPDFPWSCEESKAS